MIDRLTDWIFVVTLGDLIQLTIFVVVMIVLGLSWLGLNLFEYYEHRQRRKRYERMDKAKKELGK